MSTRIWHLTISIFAGLVPSATHYRVYLTNPEGEETVIDHVMSAREVKEANLVSIAEGFGVCFKQGDRTTGFNSEDNAREAGIAAFRSHQDRKEEDLLLEGSSCVASPQKPLVGPFGLMGELLQIWEEFDRIDGWDGGEKKRADELDAAWMEAIKKHSFVWRGERGESDANL